MENNQIFGQILMIKYIVVLFLQKMVLFMLEEMEKVYGAGNLGVHKKVR